MWAGIMSYLNHQMWRYFLQTYLYTSVIEWEVTVRYAGHSAHVQWVHRKPCALNWVMTNT